MSFTFLHQWAGCFCVVLKDNPAVEHAKTLMMEKESVPETLVDF